MGRPARPYRVRPVDCRALAVTDVWDMCCSPCCYGYERPIFVFSEKLPRRKFKVYEENVKYLKKYDNNFLYCTLTYLYRLQSPFKFSGADGEADHVIVNKSALCKLGYRIICACGSGLPCTESYWDDSRTFMECLRLKCSKCPVRYEEVSKRTLVRNILAFTHHIVSSPLHCLCALFTF